MWPREPGAPGGGINLGSWNAGCFAKRQCVGVDVQDPLRAVSLQRRMAVLWSRGVWFRRGGRTGCYYISVGDHGFTDQLLSGELWRSWGLHIGDSSVNLGKQLIGHEREGWGFF